MEELTKKAKKESAPKGKPPTEVNMSDNKKSKTSSAANNSTSVTAGSSAKDMSTTAPPMDEKKELHQTEEASKVKTVISSYLHQKIISPCGGSFTICLPANHVLLYVYSRVCGV